MSEIWQSGALAALPGQGILYFMEVMIKLTIAWGAAYFRKPPNPTKRWMIARVTIILSNLSDILWTSHPAPVSSY